MVRQWFGVSRSLRSRTRRGNAARRKTAAYVRPLRPFHLEQLEAREMLAGDIGPSTT